MANTFLSMSAEELKTYEQLLALAKQADHDYAVLIKKYGMSGFGLKATSIDVLHIDRYGEYYATGTLSIDGQFSYSDNWGGGNADQFDVSSAEAIFQAYKKAELEPEASSFFRTMIKGFKTLIAQIEEEFSTQNDDHSDEDEDWFNS